MKSDGEINQAASLKSIDEIVKSLDIKTDDLNFYGPYQAKLKPSFINTLKEPKTAKLILVSAMSPTPAGEGKTTTTIGLADALFLIGKKISRVSSRTFFRARLWNERGCNRRRLCASGTYG